MYIYTIYKTTNLINGRYYIGKHKAINPNDSYLGSGTALKLAISKYGRANFTKEILYAFEDESAAFDKEGEIVNETLINDPLSYNLSTGGLGGRTHSTESRNQMSKSMTGRVAWNKGTSMWDEANRKRITNENYARAPQSEETIAKRTTKNTGKKRTEATKLQTSLSLKGRTFSDDTKTKMSIAKKGKPWTSARRAAFEAAKL